MPGTHPDIVQARMDALARQHGFPDASTWAAWNQHRTDAIVNGSNTTTDGDPSSPTGQHQNFLQQLMGPVYPPTLIGMIGQRYKEATGQ